jgi:hypothetical protein
VSDTGHNLANPTVFPEDTIEAPTNWAPKLEDPVAVQPQETVTTPKAIVPKKKAKRKASKRTKKEKAKFNHDQMLAALYWVWDIMDRSQMTFYVVGSTADSVIENKDLKGDRITVAVRQLEWESGARRLLLSIAPPVIDNSDGTIGYEHAGIPITVYILPDEPSMTGLDTKIYHAEYFKFPTPYKQFKKAYPWVK